MVAEFNVGKQIFRLKRFMRNKNYKFVDLNPPEKVKSDGIGHCYKADCNTDYPGFNRPVGFPGQGDLI